MPLPYPQKRGEGFKCHKARAEIALFGVRRVAAALGLESEEATAVSSHPTFGSHPAIRVVNLGPGNRMQESSNTKAERFRGALPVRKKIAFATLATIVFVGLSELTLRTLGFRFQTRSPEVMVNGRTVAPMFRHTEAYNWEPIPLEGPFNEDGFIGPRLRKARTSGVYRIAAIGDSCTQFGDPPYPAVLRELLVESMDQSVEVLNAGVTGYSTEQGLRRLGRDVLPYRPDVLTIYFGWNDHWMTNKLTDAEIAVEDAQSWQWVDYLGWSRIVQAGLYGAHIFHERQSWALNTKPAVLRVPLDQYQDNLRRIIAWARQAGAQPVLITAPTDATTETPSVGFAYRASMRGSGYDSPRALHDAYVEATRFVADETGTSLVDAAAALDLRDGLFMNDHIHLTQRGITEISALIADHVRMTLLSKPHP